MPTYSPNMNLPIPIPTVTPGAEYAFNEAACFSVLDQHNHTVGSGVQIPTAGLNINANLPMNNYGLTATQLVNFQAQGSVSTAGSIYRISDDLYYKDGSGNNVRITQGGSVAVSGAIGFTGLPSGTASASYALNTFIFESATNTAAVIDGGPITIRPLTPFAQGITISAPSPLVASYGLELPGALPLSTKILQLGSAGNITAALGVDNTTIEISSNNLQVKDLGITTAKLADQSVTTAKIADLNVTTIKIDDLAVTTQKIDNLAVTTAKIDALAVTEEKMSNTGTVWTDTGTRSFTAPNLNVSPRALIATLGSMTVANSRLALFEWRSISNTSSITTPFGAGTNLHLWIELDGPGGFNYTLFTDGYTYGTAYTFTANASNTMYSQSGYMCIGGVTPSQPLVFSMQTIVTLTSAGTYTAKLYAGSNNVHTFTMNNIRYSGNILY
jgi:hypothetical protein